MKRRLSVTTAALLIAFAAVLGMGLFVLDDRADDNADEQEDVDTGYSGCLRYNDTRVLFRSVIEDAYLPTSQAPVNPALLEAFANIADPNVRTVLSGGSGVSAEERAAAVIADPNSNLNRQRNKTATRDCETEFPDHTPGIRLDDDQLVPPPPLDR